MTTDKLICAVESGKYKGATFVVGEEYIMDSTFLAKLFIRVWFRVTLPTRLAISHRASRPRWARGRKRLLVGHWRYVVFRTRGRCTLDRKDGRQIVRRLSGGNIRHYCIQEPALCDGGSMVVLLLVGIHKGWKTSLVAPDGNVNAFM